MLNGILNALSGQLRSDTATQARVMQKTEQKNDFAKALAEAGQTTSKADASVLAQIEPGAAKQTSAVQDFLKYQNLSMAEKIRASHLAQKGLTEEDLAAMSAEERLKIEEDIKEAIKRQLDPSAA